MHSVRRLTSRSVMPGEEDGHQERRHLVVGNVTAGVPVNQKLDLFRSEFFAVAFSLDQVNCTHYE